VQSPIFPLDQLLEIALDVTREEKPLDCSVFDVKCAM
jgi:hypothetical protein